MRRQLRYFILALVMIATPVFGETTGFDGQTVLANPNDSAPDAEKIADGIVQKDTSSLTFSEKEKSENDRRAQAQKAENDSNKGKSVAIATGAALTATAIPMLASPFASVRAAGAALMAKAALEFAQAGADKKAAAGNKDLKDILSKNQNDPNMKPATPDNSEAKEKLNNPALDKFLTERGVNSDDFKDKLANGELSNPEDVLRAVGDTSEISPADMAKGNALADKQFAESFHPNDKSRIGYDESNIKDPKASSSSMSGADSGGFGGATVQLPTSSAPKSSLVDGGAGSVAGTAVGAKGFAANNLSPSASGDVSALPPEIQEMIGLKGILSSIMATDPKIMGMLTVRQALERVGILTSQPKQNVFQTGHRIYRGFGKWRNGKPRLAKR